MATEARRIEVADARPQDIPAIVRMAAELSRHERDPDSFFDERRAREDLFGARPWIHGLVAWLGPAPAGMLLWHPSYETSYAARGGFVVSLWVDEPFRRRGVATELMATAAERVAAIGGVYLWWASKPGNRRAHSTYAALGAGSEQVFAHALTGDRFARLARRNGKTAETGAR